MIVLTVWNTMRGNGSEDLLIVHTNWLHFIVQPLHALEKENITGRKKLKPAG